MSTNYYAIVKTLIVTAIASAIFTTPLSLSAAVSQQPLSLTEGVSPNLLVTLDDSGSMSYAYAPDGISGDARTDNRASQARFFSSRYNPMYYNPSAKYELPKKLSYSARTGLTTVTPYPTPSFTSAPIDGYAPGKGSVDLSRNYLATKSYTPGNTGQTFSSHPFTVNRSYRNGTAAYYYNFRQDTCTDGQISQNGCYTYVQVSSTEQQNFANWYSFYRTRSLATATAANLAFHSLPENVRITWQMLNSCTNIGGGSCRGRTNNFANYIRNFSESHRQNFFDWLADIPASGATPLRAATQRAGEFLKRTDLNGPWADSPGSSIGSQFSCRPSYHILMTDGVWNEDTSINIGNYDGKSQRLPDGKTYSPRLPFSDGSSNTLADLAFKYWAEDAAPNIDNNIKPYIADPNESPDVQSWNPKNNPASWQHMVNYTLGLGLTRTLINPEWGGSTFSGGYSKFLNGEAAWPAPSSNAPQNVYELWHAAINSRGEFFSVDSPEDMVTAFQKILSRIAERNTSAASPAINSGMQDDGTGGLVSYAYQTSYSSNESWAGDIKGYLKAKTLNAVTGLYDVTTTEQWSAREQLASRPTGRNITIATPAGTLGDTDGLTDLTWSHAGDPTTAGTLAYFLRQDPDDGDTLEADSANAQLRLSFIKGDQSQEEALFRKRSTVLGDMIASKPVTVRGARYLSSYAERLHPGSAYDEFVTLQRERSPRVYVGANDGMLHGFDAATGLETFAFVPTAVFPKLHKLTGKSYQGAHHQFYVDGSPVVADVYIGSEWRTVLVGTLRAGGKGLFALDITDPSEIKLLWEFDDKSIPSSNDVRLGHSFPQPTIARLHNGKWAVVTGNGYDSTNKDNGKAALLILDMETGELTKSLEVSGAEGVANGLSTPKLADFNADGVADFAYAGDLQGNLWRFNLTPEDMVAPYIRQENETNAAEIGFKVSYANKPIFKAVTGAGARQPITAAPSIIRHPTLHGYLIVFGTGKYFEEGDKDGTSTKQSIYGIWDTDTLNPNGSLQPANLEREHLQAHSMNTTLESEITGRDARLLMEKDFKWAIPPSPTTPQWTDEGNLKYGWFFDLELNSEMVVENMVTLGRTLFFQTLVPNADPCSAGVETWTYAINPQTGGRTLHHAFVDHRSANSPDTVISAVRQDGEGGLTLGQGPDTKYELCTGLECKPVFPDPSSLGRQSWRPIGE
jgi:type IV pilus assembly protein PilY1